MTILRYDDDTIHRNGCLFGAPAIRIIIIRGDLQPSLGNSDHKSLFSPYQNEHVGYLCESSFRYTATLQLTDACT